MVQNAAAPARRLFLIGCLMMLYAPFGTLAFRFQAPAGYSEMRTLSAFPKWQTASALDWPVQFETWLDDHFPLRPQLIRLHAIIWHRIFEAPSNDVVVGRRGWLFYSGNRTLEDLVGRDKLTDAQLQQWLLGLEGRRAWLRDRGIGYLFVIEPNKSNIYPEMLPALLQAEIHPGKQDQLLAYLRKRGSSVPVLDLRPALLASKAKELVYLRTDSHWNGAGLACACDSVLNKLATLGCNASNRDLSPYLDMPPVPHTGDCLNLLGLAGAWPSPPEIVLRIRPTSGVSIVESPLSDTPPWRDMVSGGKPVFTECRSGRGRLVLFSDSFFRSGGMPADVTAQSPFALMFQRQANFFGLSNFAMMKAAVQSEHPDVVIDACSERFLSMWTPKDGADYSRDR